MRRRWKIALGITASTLLSAGLIGWWYADRTIIARMALQDGIDATDPATAEKRFTAAIRKFPSGSQGCARAYIWRSKARFALGKHNEALADAEQALQIAPQDRAARTLRGAALYKLARYGEAEKELEIVLQEKPDSVNAHYYLGLIAERAGDLWAAYDHYTEAVRENPAFAKGFAALSRVFKGMGHENNAVMYAELAKQKDPNVLMDIE